MDRVNKEEKEEIKMKPVRHDYDENDLLDDLIDDLTEQKLSHQHEVRLLKSKLSSFTKIKKQKVTDPENELKKLLDK